MNDQTAPVFAALDRFRLEVPSWGFADTGTRFGIFRQPAAAVTVAEKLADAGFVHRLTGICPTVALHMQWDLSGGIDDVATVQRLAADAGIRPGSINPTFFQDQRYKYGSFGNPDPEVRRYARAHGLASVDMATRLGSRDVSCWFADGSNYPGTASIRHRKQFFEEELRTMHDAIRRMRVLGFAPSEVMRMASLNPAKLLGIESTRGSIAVGKRADLVGVDDEGDVKLVIIGGRVAFDER